MSLRVLTVLFALLLAVVEAAAQTDLPENARAEIDRARVEQLMSEAARAALETPARHADALVAFDRLRALDVPFSASAYLMEAESAIGVQQWTRAKTALDRFFAIPASTETRAEATELYVLVEDALLLLETAAYDAALAEKSSAAYEAFLSKYPEGPYTYDVGRRLASCNKSTAFRGEWNSETLTVSRYVARQESESYARSLCQNRLRQTCQGLTGENGGAIELVGDAEFFDLDVSALRTGSSCRQLCRFERYRLAEFETCD